MRPKGRALPAVLLLPLLLLLAFSPSAVHAQDAVSAEAEADAYASEQEECFANGVDGASFKAMQQWITDVGYETIMAEQRCEANLQEMVDALIGKHGPPDEQNMKLQLCGGECDQFQRNVAELVRLSRCTCAALEQHFPLSAQPALEGVPLYVAGPSPYVHRKLPSNWCERNPLFYIHRMTGMLAVSNDKIFIGDENGDNEAPPGAMLPIMQLQSKPCKTAACEGVLIYSKVAYDWYRAQMYNMIEVSKDEGFDQYCMSMECQWSAYYFKYCRCDPAYESQPGELWCGWSGARSAHRDGPLRLASLFALVLLAAPAVLQAWR